MLEAKAIQADPSIDEDIIYTLTLVITPEQEWIMLNSIGCARTLFED